MGVTGKARAGEHGPVLGPLSPAVILMVIASAVLSLPHPDNSSKRGTGESSGQSSNNSSRVQQGGWGAERSGADRLHQTLLAWCRKLRRDLCRSAIIHFDGSRLCSPRSLVRHWPQLHHPSPTNTRKSVIQRTSNWGSISSDAIGCWDLLPCRGSWLTAGHWLTPGGGHETCNLRLKMPASLLHLVHFDALAQGGEVEEAEGNKVSRGGWKGAEKEVAV